MNIVRAANRNPLPAAMMNTAIVDSDMLAHAFLRILRRIKQVLLPGNENAVSNTLGYFDIGNIDMIGPVHGYTVPRLMRGIHIVQLRANIAYLLVAKRRDKRNCKYHFIVPHDAAFTGPKPAIPARGCGCKCHIGS
ncbi:hypothetical protein D3C78_890540 [compost metagenome]